MNILVVGSGGREHALVWKISKSKLVEKIYSASGNVGIAEFAECIEVKAEDIDKILKFSQENKIDLVVIGPEIPLVNGFVDKLEENNIKAFGPKKILAKIEGSKSFAKELMKANKIPTADYMVFDNPDLALHYLSESHLEKFVVKADGLAAGKGVFVCQQKEDSVYAVERIMNQKIFGEAGEKIVIEELLEGEEASFLVFSDGETVKPMVPSQDHKRIFDNDKGPNTGGMGAYSPAPIIDEKLQQEIMETIMIPAVKALGENGIPYKGVLYAGLMICKGKPKVLEFNCRFGDPEAQVILPRLESDLVEIMLACVEGNLAEKEIKWKNDSACCVVLASGGYPENYEKGKEIKGLEEAKKLPNTFVFHAGTKAENGKILTNGGRVLGVTALGKDIKEAIDKAYKAVSKISFENMHYRKDIGKRAFKG